MKKLASLLSDVLKAHNSSEGVADWTRPQQDKNVWGLLAVIRLFLLRGNIGTQANQRSFWQSGLLDQVLEISFHPSMNTNIRAEVNLSHPAYWKSTDCFLSLGSCDCGGSDPR